MRLWGDYWENIAFKHLKNHNLKKVKRNFNCKAGEIDIVMIDKETLVFIEVKYRKNDEWVSALESVTKKKQTRIIKAAQMFLLQNKRFDDWNCRFDVVSIQGDKNNPDIDWIQNAFY